MAEKILKNGDLLRWTEGSSIILIKDNKVVYRVKFSTIRLKRILDLDAGVAGKMSQMVLVAGSTNQHKTNSMSTTTIMMC